MEDKKTEFLVRSLYYFNAFSMLFIKITQDELIFAMCIVTDLTKKNIYVTQSNKICNKKI